LSPEPPPAGAIAQPGHVLRLKSSANRADTRADALRVAIDSTHRLIRLMNKTLHRFLVMLAALACLGGVRAEELVIPGSGNLEFVLGELAKAFNAQQGQHRVSVPPSSGTAGALRDVESGAAILGRVGRPLKDAERSRGLHFIPIGRDAVVFVAGASVSARSISRAQVLDVYSGRVTDWRELGAKPGTIRAIGRETTDASRVAIGQTIKEFATLSFDDRVKLVHLDPQLVELLDRFGNSLGFLNRSALFAAKTKVTPLALDGVDGDPQTLLDGRYPMWLEFGLVHKGASLSGAGKAFVAFVQSPSGERILRQHQVLPIAAPN
jgi:phosphate transport system substrate-binding protein